MNTRIPVNELCDRYGYQITDSVDGELEVLDRTDEVRDSNGRSVDWADERFAKAREVVGAHLDVKLLGIREMAYTQQGALQRPSKKEIRAAVDKTEALFEQPLDRQLASDAHLALATAYSTRGGRGGINFLARIADGKAAARQVQAAVAADPKNPRAWKAYAVSLLTASALIRSGICDIPIIGPAVAKAAAETVDLAAGVPRAVEALVGFESDAGAQYFAAQLLECSVTVLTPEQLKLRGEISNRLDSVRSGSDEAAKALLAKAEAGVARIHQRINHESS